MVQCDRRLACISENLCISVERVHNTITQVLGYRKDSALWVPKSCNEEQTATRMGICLEYLLRYDREGDEFWANIVGGDE